MAYRELVVNISEEAYKAIKECTTWTTWAEAFLIDLVKNVTLLSKGHGRLGDLDALREEVSSWGMNDYEPSDFTDAIDQADIIIEADECKAESEDHDSLCTQRCCLKNHNIGTIECDEQYCSNRTKE